MRRTKPGNKMENEKLHEPRRRGRRGRSLHSQLEPNNRLKFLPKQSSSRSSLSQPKQTASEGLKPSKPSRTRWPAERLLSPKQKAYSSHGTQHTNSAHGTQNGTLHELCHGTPPNKEKNLLFILLRPLPRARRDSCPRDPSPAQPRVGGSC